MNIFQRSLIKPSQMLPNSQETLKGILSPGKDLKVQEKFEIFRFLGYLKPTNSCLLILSVMDSYHPKTLRGQRLKICLLSRSKPLVHFILLVSGQLFTFLFYIQSRSLVLEHSDTLGIQCAAQGQKFLLFSLFLSQFKLPFPSAVYKRH